MVHSTVGFRWFETYYNCRYFSPTIPFMATKISYSPLILKTYCSQNSEILKKYKDLSQYSNPIYMSDNDFGGPDFSFLI